MNPQYNHHHLADILGSRICHDLVGPLGAISNGIELLQMDGMEVTPEMDLISDSIENAKAKIRFFRIAYGAATMDSMLSSTEIVAILSNYYRYNRITTDWKLVEDVPRIEAKRVFLMLQCLETALPYGAEIEIKYIDDVWVVHAEAEKFKPVQEHWAGLQDCNQPLPMSAEFVQFSMLRSLNNASGKNAVVTMDDAGLNLSC